MARNKVVGKNKRAGSNKATGRDYSKEKEFQSSEKQKKYRAELNAYNRKNGVVGNGDNLDASHKGGKIKGYEKASTNRARKPKGKGKKK